VTTEAEFARSLAEALGPLYRVTVLDRSGEVEVTFGTIIGSRTSRTILPLPRSTRTLVVELDLKAVETMDRVLHSLLPKQEEPEPAGTYFPPMHQALEHLIGLAEAQIGRPISEMTRADKQRVVRFLDEHGAFALRKAVETVADALGVSRFTVYNYLDSARQS
jgi:hypothetical protein